MRCFFIKLIKLYQYLLSPEQSVWVKIGIKRNKYTCPFYPSCSEYGIQAIEKYGVFKGINLFFRRILKCRPGAEPRVDKV